MSTDSGAKLRDVLQGLLAPDAATAAEAIVDADIQQKYCMRAGIVADAAGGTTSKKTLDPSTLMQVQIAKFYVTAHTNVTSDNTNNATINLVYNNGNGGSDTVIATCNTATAAGGGTGDLTADVPKGIALTAANVLVPAGSQIQLKITKNGAGGLQLPATDFEVKAKPV